MFGCTGFGAQDFAYKIMGNTTLLRVRCACFVDW